ncbi:type IV secretion system protein VirD2, partial [Acinetobacter baumannii]
WREAFAEKLQEHGIEATATPRTFRAVVTKGKKQPVYQAEKAGRSTVRDAKLQEALDELRGKQGKPNPARKAIASKQQEV